MDKDIYLLDSQLIISCTQYAKLQQYSELIFHLLLQDRSKIISEFTSYSL